MIKDVKFCGLGLYIVPHKVLVFGDLHLGLANYLAEQGVQVPYDYGDEAYSLIKRSISLCGEEIKTIVFAGDIKHEFGRISKEEWFGIKQLLNKLMEEYEVRVVKGNHDNIVKPILDKLGIRLEEQIQYGDFLILHGHKEPEIKDVKTIIIAHEHPAITLKKGPRQEVFKCFLVVERKRKPSIIVLPALSPLTIGTDIMKEKFFSPILQNISNEKIKIVVVGDDLNVFVFENLKDLEWK